MKGQARENMEEKICDRNLHRLQEKLKADGVKAYVVQVTDPHQTEEAHPRYLEERLALSSYLGSDGLLLVTQDRSLLWADGRYWVEAEEELFGTDTQLVRMGDFGVPTMAQYIAQNHLYPLAIDLSRMSVTDFKEFASDPEAEIVDRSYRELTCGPMELPDSTVWKVDQLLLSDTFEDRLGGIIKAMRKRGAQATLISSLDDIAYILGWRGNDLEFSPLFLSYLYLSDEGDVDLFVNAEKLPEKLDKLSVHRYDEVWDFLKEKNRKPVPTLIDPLRTAQRVVQIVKKPIFAANPSQLLKSIKGPVEISNTKRIHELDGLAVLRLWQWVDQHIVKGGETATEAQIAAIVDGYRLERKECFALSFPTIAAFRGHGAMMHYLPPKEGGSTIDNKGINPILLVDSGGQYYGGTTDITRTFCLGEASDEYIHDYTLTIKSVLDLASTIFLQGCSGVALDIKARENMWREGMDYKCGTGHGVGYMLNVHESPNGFRYRIVPERDDSAELMPGQIQSDEPGVYKAGKYGIRIENELLTVRLDHNKDGLFNGFRNITYCPVQTDYLDLNMMSDFEIERLNEFQDRCRRHLEPLTRAYPGLTDFLYEKTQPVHR